MLKLAFLGLVAWVILSIVLARIRRNYAVRMVMCVIRPEQLDDVVSALKRENLMMGMTVMNARGFGRQKGSDEQADEQQTVRFLPKLRLEMLVRHRDLLHTMDVIGDAIRTGRIGDGKIVVFDAVHAMRIRTGEQGINAL